MHARMLPSKPKAWPLCTTKSLKYGFSPFDVQRSSTLQPPDPCADRRGGACRSSHAGIALTRTSPSAIKRRLHDGAARPRVLPEHRAVGRRDADRARCAQQHDLRDAVDRREMRRAVAPAAGGAEPARLAGGDVVGGQRAATAATMTTSSTTSGELEKPQSGTSLPVSDATLRDHTTAPLPASSAFRIPVAPNA